MLGMYLTSRYGKKWPVKKANGGYTVDFRDALYCRSAIDGDGNVTMVDPDGGPYLHIDDLFPDVSNTEECSFITSISTMSNGITKIGTRLIKLNDPANIVCSKEWDEFGATIIGLSDKICTVQRDKRYEKHEAVSIKSWGTMRHFKFKRDIHAKLEVFTKRKDGRWIRKGQRMDGGDSLKLGVKPYTVWYKK
tara:strand:+ start:10994 stop:11569 length:576 start_codon:yes stop_codon:yes gene_type:complete